MFRKACEDRIPSVDTQRMGSLMKKLWESIGKVVALVGIAVFFYSTVYLDGKDRIERKARWAEESAKENAKDKALRTACREAVARTLGTPVLDWLDISFGSQKIMPTSTGYRILVVADTGGGQPYEFSCYFSNDMKTILKVTEK